MTPHEVLGVATTATPKEIKSAYRKLAMEHHPDRNAGSEDSAKRFQEIQDAYDALRSDKPQQSEQRHHQWHESNYHREYNMNEMFEQFFRRQQQGNPSVQASCDITLEQAFNGCSVSFGLPNGQQATVDIPAGVDNGQVLRIPEGAGQSNADYPAGDLIVVIRLRPHENFHRQGMTIRTRLPVDVIDVLCGSEQEVTTITGEKVKIAIPKNSSDETIVVVKGHGMNRVGGPERGDLIVHLHPQYREFTEEQLEVLDSIRKT